MFEWNLNQQDPLSLIFAPDYRLNRSKFEHDTVWEIQLDGGENGGVSLYSTLSLRCLSLRIFPVFSDQKENRIRLTDYYKSLTILKIFPNYTRIRLEPFKDLNVFMEYWFPESKTVVGKIIVNNASIHSFDGSISIAVPLSPSGMGSKMSIAKSGAIKFLVGKTHNIFPYFLMSGAPAQGNFAQPSLENKINLKAGKQQQFNWVFHWDTDESIAFEESEHWLNKSWDAELSKMEILAQKESYEIETGNAQIDSILALSQNAAIQMLVPDSGAENNPRLLMSRHPEKNYSFDESNKLTTSDTGVTPLQLWYFNQVAPGLFSFTRDILSSFFLKQHKDGFISNFSESGSGQTRYIAFPILASLSIEIYENDPDERWLKEIYPKLINYLKYWFSENQDHDQDGFPEWSNAIHSLYDNLPIHDRWNPEGVGILSKWIESPMLASLLIKELKSCIQIGELTGEKSTILWLESMLINLSKSLQSTWNRKKNQFLYRDSILHTSYAGITIYKGSGSGIFKINRQLRSIQRLVFHLKSEHEHTRNVQIFIHGRTSEGETVEEISARQIHWNGKIGFATSSFAFTTVNKIEFQHFSNYEYTEVSTADFSCIDITNLLPLWAQECSPKRTKSLVDDWINKEFLQPFGLPLVPNNLQPKESDLYNVVDLPINTLIALGLISSGYRDVARTIWSNNLSAITKNLNLFHKFMKLYDASDGYGSGDYNIINGMVPLRVLIKLAGINKWTSKEIIIDSISQFEEPVNIRYRGIMVHCNQQGHQIISPGSKIIETIGNGPHIIKLPA